MGIDPRPFSLRQLGWMARERRRLFGEGLAWHACMLIAAMPFVGKVLSPQAVNPYRGEAGESDKLARVRAAMTAIHLRVMSEGG